MAKSWGEGGTCPQRPHSSYTYVKQFHSIQSHNIDLLSACYSDSKVDGHENPPEVLFFCIIVPKSTV